MLVWGLYAVRALASQPKLAGDARDSLPAPLRGYGASQTFASWNQIVLWLRQIGGLRAA
jgi:hypothetical protein